MAEKSHIPMPATPLRAERKNLGFGRRPPSTVGRGLSLSTRGEDVPAWFDVYSGRRPPTPTIMVHDSFIETIKANGGQFASVLLVGGNGNVIGNWAYADGQLRLACEAGEYIYERTGWVTSGGFTEFGWPD
ncbi:hypothetical protein ORI20_13740 [Mycobacterium sp. CVI_P3]|uniref:Uncharacterized protein n=1 Tax=Mycobacterium pinniadriaticum TaxID=2994102 RepID=A0ABT3SFU4_9MYCO|nr:hypothetical protein [Mycobacterium pinniadriaticum]MCX2931341.1 hypothetical protein [Mycobacterium pinniadriaticum]MCX2937765.1 hypothetical protein [Mycobacterium pinniadriaticum]